ncbi:MAG: pyrroloquinoline quinone biosynthesis protein PqqB [Gammaproteobacteria bacterium]|nr:pyrroloquinoline quinone biosynthesis protein PqqB [Gammaproteobacteria bacterium]
MHIRVLGSAAGGGYPQWNCNHPNSRRARAGEPAATQRTQSSIAVSADGVRWLLCNASPDLRQQINDNPVLQPVAAGPLRASPLAAVLLTNADVDHVTGLLTLRESQAFTLYATPRVLEVLAMNSIFNVLNPAFVARRPMPLDSPWQPVASDGALLGLTITAFAVPGKVALWLEDATRPVDIGALTQDTIALEIGGLEPGRRFFYIPACARMTPALAARLQGAALVFFDGTLWVDDEMIQAGVGLKTGQRMGHLSVAGAGGSMALLADLAIQRKVFIHINTTNPILLDDSPERAAVISAGWEVAYDGMQLVL